LRVLARRCFRRTPFPLSSVQPRYGLSSFPAAKKADLPGLDSAEHSGSLSPPGRYNRAVGPPRRRLQKVRRVHVRKRLYKPPAKHRPWCGSPGQWRADRSEILHRRLGCFAKSGSYGNSQAALAGARLRRLRGVQLEAAVCNERPVIAYV
jgi:hypothetical protein